VRSKLSQKEQRHETVNWVAHQEDLPIAWSLIAKIVFVIAELELHGMMSLGNPDMVVT
jgi:hypothetical protein